MKKCEVVCHGSHIWKQVADVFSALPIRLEVPFGADNTTALAVSTSTKGFDFDSFVVEGIESGFVVKSIDVTWATIHKQEYD